MDLRQINYFLALYDEGSVTRAAQRMNVVQPALSMQIAKLERELGQKLFERTPKRMVPTPAAHTLHRLVTPIQRDLAAAMAQMANLSGAVTGKVSLGVLSSLTRSVMPAVLADFALHYPDVEVSVANGDSRTCIEAVKSGRLDFAVVSRPTTRLGLEAIPLLDEEIVLVGAKDNTPELRTLPDLATLALALPSMRHSLRLELEQHLAPLVGDLSPKLEVDSIDALADLVARSTLFTVLPGISVHQQLVDGRLVAHAIGRTRVARSLVVIHQARHPPGAAAMLLIERIRDALRLAREALEGRVVRKGRGTQT